MTTLPRRGDEHRIRFAWTRAAEADRACRSRRLQGAARAVRAGRTANRVRACRDRLSGDRRRAAGDLPLRPALPRQPGVGAELLQPRRRDGAVRDGGERAHGAGAGDAAGDRDRDLPGDAGSASRPRDRGTAGGDARGDPERDAGVLGRDRAGAVRPASHRAVAALDASASCRSSAPRRPRGSACSPPGWS